MSIIPLAQTNILSKFFCLESCDNARKGIMVIHILKNGEVIPDISGHEVTEKDVPMFYEIANRIKEESSNETNS